MSVITGRPDSPPAAQPKNKHLDAMRGVMALMVLVSHINLMRLYFGRSEAYNHPVIYHLGRVALIGFFVLSGYLITYTILKRRERNNWTLGRFYMARIFRIWPLYYIVILLAVFVLPHIAALYFAVSPSAADVRIHTEYYKYYFFFLPQIPSFQRAILPFAEPTWSIGVEEIFYVTIPLIVLLARKKLAQSLAAFIIIFIAVKYGAMLIPGQEGKWLYKLMHFYRYDCIALGCLAGVLHFNKSKWFAGIGRRELWLASAMMLAVFFSLDRKSLEYFPFAIGFVVIIAYLVNKNHLLKSPKWLVYLGTISYSFYLTHEIAIVFLVNRKIDQASLPLMYFLSLLSTMGLASVFYFAVERPFMRWREKLELKYR